MGHWTTGCRANEIAISWNSETDGNRRLRCLINSNRSQTKSYESIWYYVWFCRNTGNHRNRSVRRPAGEKNRVGEHFEGSLILWLKCIKMFEVFLKNLISDHVLLKNCLALSKHMELRDRKTIAERAGGNMKDVGNQLRCRRPHMPFKEFETVQKPHGTYESFVCFAFRVPTLHHRRPWHYELVMIIG